MFDTVLVANRGEIAVRIIRTLRRLGIRSVAVYSDADAGARHVRDADVAYRIGPTPPRDSYLHIGRVLDAARSGGAQAVHPGYGFLSENADFAAACETAGLVFIGPAPEAIRIMGDKVRAKQVVTAAGVPVVPGRTDAAMTDDDLIAAAAEIGYPVLVKPAAGGGGKGMRRVEHPADLPDALAAARREAAGSFGDDTLFVERYVTAPRHIEVQVLADAHGGVIHLGERECSLQRRHQKVVEEAPSPLLDAATRARIGAGAADVARAVGYTGAGTVEFIASADQPDTFFFIEMNTRLQVEHPVTEMVTGLDLVEWQLRIAAGEPLALTQADVRHNGHAIEARVYAEDPARGFLPTGGRARAVHEPIGPGIRVDSSLDVGTIVGTAYDPMLAKVIAWGPDRPTALARLGHALADTAVLGVGTNVAFLRRLLAHPAVVAGELDTGLIERTLDDLAESGPPDLALIAFAMARTAAGQPAGPVRDPWDALTGFRLSAPPTVQWTAECHGEPVSVVVSGSSVLVGDRPYEASAVPVDDGMLLTVDGRTCTVRVATDGPTTWVAVDGGAWPIREARARSVRTDVTAHDGEVTSPMPGTVVSVTATTGGAVTTGDILLVVEAMKMEHVLRAPIDGTATVHVRAGDQVTLDQRLATIHSGQR
ncbi:biotin carboxylase N-terminal domain-containing protein [Dactylosporangium sp. NPDC051485]|uniref:ATP-binding protein n=1 Tax=Dactylosporangium sp. NPDC051485 TaxID=3154846 RepID=UPI003440D71C